MRKIKVALPAKVEKPSLAPAFVPAYDSSESSTAPKEIDFTESINGLVRRRFEAALNVLAPLLTGLAGVEYLRAPGWSGAFTMSLATALFAVGLRLALIGVRLPGHWTHPLTASLAGLVTANSLLHLLVNPAPAFFLPLLLIAAGAGFFLLSTSWLLLVLGLPAGAWLLVGAVGAPLPHTTWLPYGLGLLVAGGFSYFVHRHQLASCQRLLWMEVEEDNQRKSIAEAFLRAQEAEAQCQQLSHASFEANARQQKLRLEHQHLQQQNQRQTALAELDWTIDQPAQLLALLDRVAQTAATCLPAPDGACVLLWEPKDQRFLVGATTLDHPIARSLVPEACCQPGTAIHWVFTRQESLVAQRPGPDTPNLQPLFGEKAFSAYAVLPMLHENEVLGLLMVVDTQTRDFKPEDLAFLNTLAVRSAAAITRAQFHDKLRQSLQRLEEQKTGLEQRIRELEQAQETSTAQRAKLEHHCQDLQSQITDLTHAKESVSAAHRAQAEFLANISPELRTPMNGILGMTALLQSSSLTAEQQDYLETLNTSAESLLKVINDVLEFANLDPNHTPRQPADFNLLLTIKEIVASFVPSAIEKDLELCCWIPEDLPATVHGNPAHLSEVLRHLLSNAIKYTPRGEVLLSVARDSETPGEIILRFTVQDTGIGLEPELLAQWFDPQTETGRTPKPAHLPSGLGHIKNLVEKMQGQMGAESTKGQSAIFWFTVGLEKRDTPPAVSPFNPEILAGKSILIVDDNSTHRLMLKQAASASQMRVQLAANADEAYHLLRQDAANGHHFSVVLIDQHMPGMDGLTLASTLHADPNFQNLRLVLMSKANQPPDPSLVNSLGLAACLTKPIYPGELNQCLASLLHNRFPT